MDVVMPALQCPEKSPKSDGKADFRLFFTLFASLGIDIAWRWVKIRNHLADKDNNKYVSDFCNNWVSLSSASTRLKSRFFSGDWPLCVNLVVFLVCANQSAKFRTHRSISSHKWIDIRAGNTHKNCCGRKWSVFSKHERAENPFYVLVLVYTLSSVILFRLYQPLKLPIHLPKLFASLHFIHKRFYYSSVSSFKAFLPFLERVLTLSR